VTQGRDAQVGSRTRSMDRGPWWENHKEAYRRGPAGCQLGMNFSAEILKRFILACSVV